MVFIIAMDQLVSHFYTRYELRHYFQFASQDQLISPKPRHFSCPVYKISKGLVLQHLNYRPPLLYLLVLSNYRYLLFRLVQKNSLYPVDIYFDNLRIENIKEETFNDKLRDIFNNPKTEETVKSLYAQSVQMSNYNG